MRIIVTGSRDWGDPRSVEYALDTVYHLCSVMQAKLTLVHGACPTGADRVAQDWYDRRSRNWGFHAECERHPANWNQYGKAAGPKRNLKMLDAGADLVLAFWDGKSPGTGHMIRMAEMRSIPVLVKVRM